MFELIVGSITLIFLIYKWLTWNYQYWEKQNIPYIEPSLIFGNIKDLLLLRKNYGESYDDLYRNYPNEPALGIYNLRQPQLIIKDPKLYKILAVSEFSSFHDNTIKIDASVDPVASLNPFVVGGDRWKKIRTISTKNLTMNKIKSMIPLMIKASLDMIEYVNNNLGKTIQAKELGGKYTTDVTSSCAFGVEGRSFTDPDSIFRKNTNEIFKPTLKTSFVSTIMTFAPYLNKIFRMRIFPETCTNFFKQVVEDTCKLREEKKYERDDFIQVFINEKKSGKNDYSYEEIMAHLLTFIIDGYETSSILISYILYQLAIHTDVQDKLRNELKEKVTNFEELNLELLNSLKYLDAVVNETLRFYPPASVLTKECTKDIKIEYSDRTYNFKKGVTIAIPLFSLQRDARYLDKPLEYKPDRFLDAETSGSAFEILSFGMGPRACIGQKFGTTQSKIAIVALVSNFIVEPAEIVEKMTWDPYSTILLLPQEPLKIKFRKC